MNQYVQYDDKGNITATVMSDKAPNCERQIQFDGDITGMKVDVVTRKIIPDPNWSAQTDDGVIING